MPCSSKPVPACSTVNASWVCSRTSSPSRPATMTASTTFPPSWAAPMAVTVRGSSPVTNRTVSMSCTVMSRTTPEPGAAPSIRHPRSRCGSSTAWATRTASSRPISPVVQQLPQRRGARARCAGGGWCPARRPRCAASSTMARASATVSAIGFSHSTCRPAGDRGSGLRGVFVVGAGDVDGVDVGQRLVEGGRAGRDARGCGAQAWARSASALQTTRGRRGPGPASRAPSGSRRCRWRRPTPSAGLIAAHPALARPRRRRPSRSSRAAVQDVVGALLADHDRRSLGVAADQRGHHRGVDDAQAAQAAHPQLLVDHGGVRHAHRAGPDRVVVGLGPLPDVGADLAVGAHVRAGHVLALDERRVGLRGQHLAAPLEAADRDLPVVRVVEEVRVDGRRDGRGRPSGG